MSLADELVALRDERAQRERDAAERSRHLVEGLYRDHFAFALQRLEVVAKEAAKQGRLEAWLCDVDEISAVGECDAFRHYVALRLWNPRDDERKRGLFDCDKVRLATVDQRRLLREDATGWVAADENAGSEVIRHDGLRELWVAIDCAGLRPFFRNRDPFRYGRTGLWIRLP
jgi:hypothetical protein